eukprot:449591_1
MNKRSCCDFECIMSTRYILNNSSQSLHPIPKSHIKPQHPTTIKSKMSQADSVIMILYTMEFKEGKVKELFKMMKDPENGLHLTRNWPGFISVEFFIPKDNENKVIVTVKMESEETYDKYFKMRTDTGFFDVLNPLLASPPVITKLNPILL